MLQLKNVLGLCVSVLGLLICLLYKNSLTLHYNMNKINDKIFDQKLITLGDYSVQGKITSHQWGNFMLRLNEDEKEKAVLQFEGYLKEELQKWLA